MNVQLFRFGSLSQGNIYKLGMALVVMALCGVFVLCPPVAQAGTVIGPIVPYFGPSQSPFNPASFNHFYYENFETGTLTVPGVTLSPGTTILTGSLVDSVEGPGPAGYSLFTGDGNGGITFTFNAGVLGSLPTAVGIVWTDGDLPSRFFQAYDQNNVLIGSITDSSGLFFSTGGDDNPANYRFFGATNAGGISSIHISNSNGGIEVDDLQYGVGPKATTAPEPGSLLLLGSGLMGIAGTLRRKKK